MSLEGKSPIEKLTETDLFRQVGEICSAVNVVVSEKELLELSLKKTLKLFSAKRGSIFILDENQTDLTLKIAEGMERDETASMVKRLGEGIVGRVAELKEPVVVDDIASDDRFENYKARQSYQTASFICAPLILKDQLIGVINIADKESGTSFSKNDLQLLDFLTSQIALNYRRIQIYHKFKTVVKESQNLKDRLGETDQEREYLKKQIEIHEKLATIGKLAGGIAHEFNNPLDGVMRYTNLCLDHSENDEVMRGYLLEIRQGLNRMAKIVKNLLACSRNEMLSAERVDVADVIARSAGAQKIEIEQKNIDLQIDIEEGLPLIPDLGIDRVMANLLRNAVDAVDNDGKINITAKRNNGGVMIEVIDNGKGIPDEEIETIFEPFYTTKDMEKGCGLGLTIVSEIIKSYNGAIKVGSGDGQGAAFTIDIPIES